MQPLDKIEQLESSRESNIFLAHCEAQEFNAMLDEEAAVKAGMAHMGDDPLEAESV